MHTTVQRRLYQAKLELALCVALLVVGLVVEMVVGVGGGMLMLVGGLLMLIGAVGGRRAARDKAGHRGMIQVLAGQLAAHVGDMGEEQYHEH